MNDIPVETKRLCFSRGARSVFPVHPFPQTQAKHYAPNLMSINAANFTFGSNFHDLGKIVHDVAGGLATTFSIYKGRNNPLLKSSIEKYLGGKASVPTEDRIRSSGRSRTPPITFCRSNT